MIEGCLLPVPVIAGLHLLQDALVHSVSCRVLSIFLIYSLYMIVKAYASFPPSFLTFAQDYLCDWAS